MSLPEKRVYSLLIVDDEPIEREAMSLMVSRNFPDIAVAGQGENGFEAVELCRILRPDIVLIDINMPGMDGLEAVREMIREGAASKFIIVTSYSTFEYARTALRLGVEDFLVKPADPETIRSAFDSVKAKIDSESDTALSRKDMADRLNGVQPVIESDLIRLLEKGGGQDFRTLFGLLNLHPLSSFVLAVRCGGSGESLIQRLTLRLEKAGLRGIGGTSGDRILFIVFSLGEPVRPGDVTAALAEYAAENITASCRFGAGEAVEDPDLLGDSCRTALHCLEYGTAMPSGGFPGQESRLEKLAAALKEGDGSRQNAIVLEALEYIRLHYRNSISLEDLAGHLSLSTFHASKVIKRTTDLTFSDILTEFRIDEALRLLGDDRLSIKEVTFRVGFNSQHYFSRIFKKQTGLSPSEYRNRRQPDF